MERWDSCLHVVASNWRAFTPAQKVAWGRYETQIHLWESWHTEVETVSVPDRARPYPQSYGATAIWAAACGLPVPVVPPIVTQLPFEDDVSLMLSPGPPPPPAPLASHVWATWSAPGGWGGRPVVAGVWARSTVPLKVSNWYWRRCGWGGVVPIRPGVPVLLDAALVSCGCSGASLDSWVRIVLMEPGVVPFYVGPQVRGPWFVDVGMSGWGWSEWGLDAWGL